jgi:hypothetical protein
MLLAFSGLPVFIEVQAVNSIDSTAYETWATAALSPLDDILSIKARALGYVVSQPAMGKLGYTLARAGAWSRMFLDF